MKKSAGIAVFVALLFICSISDSFAADAKIERLYGLYNSTSTPAIYKDRLGSILQSLERRWAVIEAAREKSSKSAAPSALKTASAPSAAPSFQAGEVYCFPNPARKTNPVFHIETGIADKVELYIYDVSGSLVHEAVITSQPQVIDDGQGPQYAYEYAWDVSKTASGVYPYSMKAVKDSRVIRKTGKCAVIR